MCTPNHPHRHLLGGSWPRCVWAGPWGSCWPGSGVTCPLVGWRVQLPGTPETLRSSVPCQGDRQTGGGCSIIVGAETRTPQSTAPADRRSVSRDLWEGRWPRGGQTQRRAAHPWEQLRTAPHPARHPQVPATARAWPSLAKPCPRLGQWGGDRASPELGRHSSAVAPSPLGSGASAGATGKWRSRSFRPVSAGCQLVLKPGHVGRRTVLRTLLSGGPGTRFPPAAPETVSLGRLWSEQTEGTRDSGLREGLPADSWPPGARA